jgi:hypothetical protein
LDSRNRGPGDVALMGIRDCIECLEALSAHVEGGAHVRFAFDLSLTVTRNGWGIEVPTNDALAASGKLSRPSKVGFLPRISGAPGKFSGFFGNRSVIP